MKKTYVSLMLAAVVTGSLLTGCGSASTSETTKPEEEAATESAGEAAQESGGEAAAETGEDQEPEDSDFIPADFIQERAGKDTFDSYDDVLSYLDGKNEGFAYLSLTGSTPYVLAVSDKVSTEDSTAVEADFYAFNDDGKLVQVGMAYGDETHPLRSDDSTLYACTNTEYGEMQLNSDSHGLTYVKHVEKFQTGDGASSYSGFVREKAEGDSVETHDVETDEQFAALFDAISDVPPIAFQRAAYSSYDEIISRLPSGAGYAYIRLNGYEGDVLAVSSSTYEDNGIHCAIDAVLYAENNGRAELLASIQTGGTAYPVTVEDGILYYNRRDQFAQADVTKNADGKHQLHYIRFAAVSYSTDGKASFETKGDISAADITNEDDFYNLFTETEGKTPVDFTPVD